MLVRYLMFACGEEIVGLEGRESNLASVFAVLTVLLSSVDCAHSLIIEGQIPPSLLGCVLCVASQDKDFAMQRPLTHDSL